MQNKQTSVKQGTWNAIWAFQNKDIQKIGSALCQHLLICNVSTFILVKQQPTTS